MKMIIPWNRIIARLEGRESLSEQKEMESWLDNEQNNKLFESVSRLYREVQEQGHLYSPDVKLNWEKMQNRMHKGKSSVFKKTYLWGRKYAAVFLLVVFSSFATYCVVRYSMTHLQVVAQSYESVDGKSKVVLPDGTVAWINRKSVLCYESKPGDDKRRVSLRGEAFFDVVKDAKREFIVDLGGAWVHVHGTKFNVNSRLGSDVVSVALVQGSVAFVADEKCTDISPGEKLSYFRSKKKIVVGKADVLMETLWADSRVHLENKSLREIGGYIEKWYGVTVVISPLISDNQAYSFTFTDEGLEEILRLMARIHPFAFSFSENNTLFINPL